MILFTTFIVSICSIVYELGFSYILSLLYGNTTIIYSVTIGLFLFFLGVGAYIYEYIKIDNTKLFYIVEMILSIVGFSSAYMFFFFNVEFERIYGEILSYIIISIIAILSGMEIPILTNMRNDRKFTKVLSIDYFGSLVGTLLYAFYLLPEFNIINTLFLISILNIVITIILSLYNRNFKFTMILSIIFFIYMVLINIVDIDVKIKDYYLYNKISKNIEKQFPGQYKKSDIDINRYFDTEYQEIIDANITLYPTKDNIYNRRCIYINGEDQLCNDWVNEYHTFLVDIPLLMFDKERELNILILGGGDLVAAYHFLKDSRVKHIDLIDIDRSFVDYSSNNLKSYNKNVLDDKRFHLIIDDAYHYILEHKFEKKYDIVVNDLPVITNEKLLPLLSVEFYKKLYNISSEDMILSSLSNSNDEIKEFNIYACSGFNKILITDGFNIEYNPFIEYSDRFFYLSKNREFEVKIDNNDYIDKNILSKIYENSIEYNLICNKNIKNNSIFSLDYSLIVN